MTLMVSGYRLMQCQPESLNMVDPRLIHRLINHDEFWIGLQPTLRFMAFMNDVVIHDQRDSPSPSVTCSQVYQQADKQLRAPLPT